TGDHLSHEAATRRSDRAFSSRSANAPVTLTRLPTWSASRSACVASTTSTLGVPFFRNPDFQLRAFGASAPLTSLRRKPSPSRSRQPAIVTIAGAFAAGTPDVADVPGVREAAPRLFADMLFAVASGIGTDSSRGVVLST